MLDRIANSPVGQGTTFQGVFNDSPLQKHFKKINSVVSECIKILKFTFRYCHYNLKALSLTYPVKGFDKINKVYLGALSLLLVDFPCMLGGNIAPLRFLAGDKCISNRKICKNILGHSRHVVSYLFSSPPLKSICVIAKRALELSIIYDKLQAEEKFYHDISQAKIDPILQTRTEEVALPLIRQWIAEYQLLEFSVIKQHFKEKGIDFNQTRMAPTNQQDWETCLQDMEFPQKLAEQWAKDQQVIQNDIWQALKKATLAKYSVDKKILFIEILDNVLKASFALLELPGNLVIKRLCPDLTQYPLAILVTLTYPFYAPLNMSFKASYFLLKIIKCFLMHCCKPFEYGLEGYMLSIQISLFKGISCLCYCLSMSNLSQKYSQSAKDSKAKFDLLEEIDNQQGFGLSDGDVDKLSKAFLDIHRGKLFFKLCKQEFHIKSEEEDPSLFKIHLQKHLRAPKRKK